jgi:hypothetical protein
MPVLTEDHILLEISVLRKMFDRREIVTGFVEGFNITLGIDQDSDDALLSYVIWKVENETPYTLSIRFEFQATFSSRIERKLLDETSAMQCVVEAAKEWRRINAMPRYQIHPSDYASAVLSMAVDRLNRFKK